MKKSVNGTQVIEKLGIASESVLVTSRYDDIDVQLACEKIVIKIILKAFASRISIQTTLGSEMVRKIDSEQYTMLIRRRSGESLQPSSAETLNDAVLSAKDLISQDSSIQRVVVLEKATSTALGSIDAETDEWRPSSGFPVRRMTWH